MYNPYGGPFTAILFYSATNKKELTQHWSKQKQSLLHEESLVQGISLIVKCAPFF